MAKRKDPLVPQKTLLTQLNTIMVLSTRLVKTVESHNNGVKRRRLGSMANAINRLGKDRK